MISRLAILCAGVTAICAASSYAQVPDHLKCYKIKDTAPKAVYTADLGGLTSEPGCQVKVPAKMLCVETAKENVNPAPPGGGPTPAPAGAFLCYKAKCVKAVIAPVSVTDQFGARSVQPSVAKMLCAPVDSGITSTTSTTTTTTTSTTSTTATLPTCGNAVAPQCNGTCGGGQTCTDLGGACGCL
jgi:hypothetical protein